MKKILSGIISTFVLAASVHSAAAASPKVVFDLDCDTQDKQVSIGYQSDPDSPANGPEVIAVKFVFEITPSGTSTFADIQNASLAANPAFSNFIVAENNKTENTNSVEITFAGGFTGGTGAPQANDLIFVNGINQKAYRVSVKSGEMYPKNSTDNIYQATNEFFVADPASCTLANNGSDSGTGNNNGNTSTNTSTTNETSTQETSIALTSNVESASAGEPVEVTAIITNRNNQSIDWSQTAGSQISPQISNEELPDGTTKSVLSFTMVESNQDIILRLVVGNASEQITVDTETANQQAAPTETETPTGVQETGTSLQERLQQRREELNAQATPTTTPTAQPTNVHGAAGTLSESGPAETGLLVLLSLAALVLWKRVRPSEVNVDV